MALPATFNIDYYRGDTYDFYIRPKDQDGNAISLAGYTPAFSIATERGIAPYVDCNAVLEQDDTVIHCKIAPAEGSTLDGDTVYVYDVEVSNGLSGDDLVVKTYLTGTVTVTEDVSTVD